MTGLAEPDRWSVHSMLLNWKDPRPSSPVAADPKRTVGDLVIAPVYESDVEKQFIESIRRASTSS
jgi:hypothetical protein